MTGRKRSRYQEHQKRNPQAMAVERAVLRKYRAVIEEGGRVPCSVCRKWITKLHTIGADNQLALSIDHVRPYSPDDPATWDASNLQPAHRACNRRKGRGRISAPTGAETPDWSRW